MTFRDELEQMGACREEREMENDPKTPIPPLIPTRAIDPSHGSQPRPWIPAHGPAFEANAFMAEACCQAQEQAQLQSRVKEHWAAYARQCGHGSQLWAQATVEYLMASAFAEHWHKQSRDYYELAFYRLRVYPMDPMAGGEEPGGSIAGGEQPGGIDPSGSTHATFGFEVVSVDPVPTLMHKDDYQRAMGIDPSPSRGKSRYTIESFLAAATRGESAMLATMKGTFTFTPAVMAGAKEPGGSK